MLVARASGALNTRFPSKSPPHASDKERENFAFLRRNGTARPVEAAPFSTPLGSPRATIHPQKPHALVEAIAFFLPFAGAIAQTRGEALWRSDAATIAALEGAGVFRGAFSQWLSQLALHLPLGSQSFRIALPGAVFLGLAGWCALHLCHSLFKKQGGHARFDRWWALGVSLSVSFSLRWVSEATLAGGSVIGGALAPLCIQVLSATGVPRGVPRALLAGVVLA